MEFDLIVVEAAVELPDLKRIVNHCIIAQHPKTYLVVGIGDVVVADGVVVPAVVVFTLFVIVTLFVC